MKDLKLIKADIDARFKEMERKYPNRHKEIHKQLCKNCPSQYGHDPETQQIKDTCSKEWIAKNTLFVCGWRGSKLCKGYCDSMDIDQEYIDNLSSHES